MIHQLFGTRKSTTWEKETVFAALALPLLLVAEHKTQRRAVNQFYVQFPLSLSLSFPQLQHKHAHIAFTKNKKCQSHYFTLTFSFYDNFTLTFSFFDNFTLSFLLKIIKRAVKTLDGQFALSLPCFSIMIPTFSFPLYDYFTLTFSL